jgi:hypothetical protein
VADACRRCAEMTRFLHGRATAARRMAS